MPPSNEARSNNLKWISLFSLGTLSSVLIAILVKLRNASHPLSAPNQETLTESKKIGRTSSSTTDSTQDKQSTPQLQPTTLQALQSPTTWSAPTKYIVGVFLFLLFLSVIFISRNVLSTLILAFLLSFTLVPVIKFFQDRLRMRRGSAILVTYVLLFLLLLLTPLIVLPALVDGVQSFIDFLSNELPEITNHIITWTNTTTINMARNPILNATIVPTLDTLSSAISEISSISEKPEYFPTIKLDTTFQNLGSRLGQVLGVLTSVLGPFVSTLTTLGFTILISLHMSLGAETIHNSYIKIVPEPYRPEIEQLVERLLLVWNAFLRGQISLMLIIGVIVYLGNLGLGTSQALFLGILAGFLEVIPNLGPILATIPAIILALVLGSSWIPVPNWVFALIVLLFYLIVQMLENQMIVPRIMGDAVDIPPVIVITGCMVGGSIAGILGVFLAAPMIASAKVIVTYLYDKILEKPPMLPPPEPELSLMDTVKGWLGRLRKAKDEQQVA